MRDLMKIFKGNKTTELIKIRYSGDVVTKGDDTTKMIWRYALMKGSYQNLIGYALCKDYSNKPTDSKAMFILNILRSNQPTGGGGDGLNQSRYNTALMEAQKGTGGSFVLIENYFYSNVIDISSELRCMRPKIYLKSGPSGSRVINIEE